MKYVNTGVVFQEIPDEVTLSINISNCPCHCQGCHSQYLWEDIGNPLTAMSLNRMIEQYGTDITCICFMGGDAETATVNSLAQWMKSAHPEMHIGWYSGRTKMASNINLENFDYIKLGPYIKDKGGLDKETTNQRLYKIADGEMTDITSRFWKKH
ncbi:MAG: anaerobic ribonucleoside-triphosphate reductase activating protein [Prevotellaceae bacterium]|nr:anaerobic ribonucleoside-triphosphate reductase activating protein [Prevotellaceae bacterium]MDO4931950.1 anaerobic ribonucleoside-triphosphate reductase activating protein [Prevotellaceae bacterium]